MTRPKVMLDYDVARHLLDQIREMQLTNEINFYHMGESLLNKRAIDIFSYAKGLGFKIKLNTNGSKLDAEMREKILPLNIDKLYISYHSSYVKYQRYVKYAPTISFEKWHEQIVSTVEDRYRLQSKSNITVILFKAAKALKNIQTEDVRVLDTEEELGEALEVWLELGKRLGQEYSLPYLYDQDTRGFVKRSLQHLLDRADKTFPVIPGFKLNLVKVHTWNNDVVCSKAKSKPVKKAYFGSCDALSDSMAIFSDGSYSLCCADWDGRLAIGNAKTEKLKDFLYSERVEAIREKFAKGKLPFDYCRQCRGGPTVPSWAFNQAHSYIYYRSPLYRKLRGLLNMQ